MAQNYVYLIKFLADKKKMIKADSKLLKEIQRNCNKNDKPFREPKGKEIKTLSLRLNQTFFVNKTL